MTRITKLQCLIEETTEKLRATYDETLKTLKELKDKMRSMELAICTGENNAVRQAIMDLNSASANLEGLTSSLISKSKSAWEQYRRYEADCVTLGVESSKLAELRVQCEKTEGLATDLLCYSLGRFGSKNVL